MPNTTSTTRLPTSARRSSSIPPILAPTATEATPTTMAVTTIGRSRTTARRSGSMPSTPKPVSIVASRMRPRATSIRPSPTSRGDRARSRSSPSPTSAGELQNAPKEMPPGPKPTSPRPSSWIRDWATDAPTERALGRSTIIRSHRRPGDSIFAATRARFAARAGAHVARRRAWGTSHDALGQNAHRRADHRRHCGAGSCGAGPAGYRLSQPGGADHRQRHPQRRRRHRDAAGGAEAHRAPRPDLRGGEPRRRGRQCRRGGGLPCRPGRLHLAGVLQLDGFDQRLSVQRVELRAPGFEPVSVLTQIPLALVVRPDFPAANARNSSPMPKPIPAN